MAAPPTLFVSHGAPTTVIDPSPVHAFFEGLGGLIDRPRAILCVSAHWETEAPTVGTISAPETIHDFWGFPDELYHLRYAPPGAPGLAARTARLLEVAGLPCEIDAERGLDHGAWVPLLLAFPAADIPVCQLSIQHRLGPVHHFEVGRAIADLRRDGVLVLASGGATHNVPDAMARRAAGQTAVPDWARGFDDWLATALTEGRIEALLDYRARAPGAVAAHPRDEHFLPLFVALGAADRSARARRLHAGFEFGSLSMAAFAFESDAS